MSVTGFIYDDDIINGINNMSFSTNVLEKYDNVTYHCALFAFNADTQQRIDEEIMKTNRVPKNFFEENKRVYIAKDSTTTKFSIKSFSMKNTFGNVNSPMNIATFEIKIKLIESLSCIFANELEALAYYTGYDGYIYRPYWFEVWFSGYDHNTLMPVSRIPLDDKNITSLIYEGCFTSIKSHLESTGTTWDITFTPTSLSLLNKNTNLFSVPVLAKDDTPISLKQFMQNCSNAMYKRFLTQIAKNDKEINDIMAKYNEHSSDGFITIKYVDLENKVQTVNSDSKVVGQQIAEEKAKQKKEQEQKEKEKQNQNAKTDQAGAETKQKEQQVSSADVSASGKNIINNKMDYFTTVCQDFLLKSEGYKDYIAKYDIKSKLLGYYNKMALYYHIVTITFLKDPYIAQELAKMKNESYELFDKVSYFNKCRKDGSLIKRYQYGYSGMDTSVLEVFNNYDLLYYMNALPQTSLEYNKNNVGYKNEKLSGEKVRWTPIASNEDLKKDIDTFTDYLEAKRKGQIDNLGKITLSGNLEDIYKNTLYEKLKNGDLYHMIATINNVPEINNDSTNNIKPSSSGTDTEKEKITISAKLLWERLYKSGQQSATKFTILGDPYWIATHSYMLKEENRTEEDAYKESLIMDTTPNYRCVFTIRSTPDQNDYYSKDNPTDYTFEYSMNASGIYLMTDCESIFEDGKFTQKLSGVLDSRFVKENK